MGAATPVAVVEAQLKDIVQNLYNLIVQPFDHQGSATQDAMKREMYVHSIRISISLSVLTMLQSASLVQNLVKLSQSAPQVNILIPPEVAVYVENSRNPDVFTREFVETVQRMNQSLKGRSDAYRLMRDTLALDIARAMPELEGDVRKVMASTGDTLVLPAKT